MRMILGGNHSPVAAPNGVLAPVGVLDPAGVLDGLCLSFISSCCSCPPVGTEQKRKVEGRLRYYPLALVIMPQRQLRQFGRSYQVKPFQKVPVANAVETFEK